MFKLRLGQQVIYKQGDIPNGVYLNVKGDIVKFNHQEYNT